MKTQNKVMIVLGLSFLLRLFLIINLKTYVHPRIWEYEAIANNLMAGKGFIYYHLGGVPYASYVMPLYIFICAGIYFITNHSYLAVLLIQSVFFVLLIYIIFYLGKFMLNEMVGLLSATLVALHPGFIYYDVFNLVPLSIDAFIIALITLLFLRFKNSPNLLNMSLIGCLIGFGILSRSIIAVILPFLYLYIFLFLRFITLKKKIMIIFYLTISTFIIISPWIIRNYIIYKRFVLASFSGEALWRGNNIHSSGTCLSKEGRPILELFSEDFRRNIYSLDELGQKDLFEKEAINFIKDHPIKASYHYLRKIFYFFWISPQTGISYPKVYMLGYKLYYILILLLFIFGLFKIVFEKNNSYLKQDIILIMGVIIAICLVQSIFYVEGRHRWLVEPLIIIFSAAGLKNLLINFR